MQKVRIVRNHLLAAALLAIMLGSAPMQAHATSKEIIELQTQVQQLLDMVQRLQSTLDARFSVLQHLSEQTADNANQMTAAVNALQQKINVQEESISGKLDTNSGQVQSLNDSVDELKTRVAKIDKAMQDMQAQLQTMQTPPPAAAPLGPNGMPQTGQLSAAAPPVNQAPPLKDTYQSAIRDFNAGKYDVAAGEFQDVIHYYPLDDLAGAAQYYLGEIAYQQGNYSDAIQAYNAVLEGFSGNAKAPSAQLHKGLALLKMKKRLEAIHELRQLIQRYPQTPEAAQARNKLASMNVKVAGR